jgi:protein-S-isoprenylcysteine O-methyltransferase Ste14
MCWSIFHSDFRLFAFGVQLVGMFLTALGYLVFVWSVIARGRYSVAWAMPEHQKLVTRGPYRYVRHPSYLGYFLMFIGLVLLRPTLPTLFSIVAIPGYYRLTFEEERLLETRFGEEYHKYQKTTGRFIPKLG